MNNIKKMPLPSAAEGAVRDATTSPQIVRTPIDMLHATITAVQTRGVYKVLVGDVEISARVGVLLPDLVEGDQVLVASRGESNQVIIVAVLAADESQPWENRAITLQSEQSITLNSGQATLTLTAEGLARLVALTIEHDARDLVGIGGAEVRIN